MLRRPRPRDHQRRGRPSAQHGGNVQVHHSPHVQRRALRIPDRARPAGAQPLKLGTRVWIRMGYGDRSRPDLLLSGYITGVGTSFAEGASPDLEVSGQDALYRLTLGTTEHRFEDQSVRHRGQQGRQGQQFQADLQGHAAGPLDADSNCRATWNSCASSSENFSTRNEKWEFFSRASENRRHHLFPPAQHHGARDRHAQVGRGSAELQA